MVKFFGNPLQEVRSKSSGQFMFRFDTKGEFITDDENFIRRALGVFDSMEIVIDKKETETKKVVKKTTETPKLKIEKNSDVIDKKKVKVKGGKR